jgi:hypothetical protein
VSKLPRQALSFTTSWESKENVMSNTATKKIERADVNSFFKGVWKPLTIQGDLKLEMLDRLEITEQLPGVDQDLIFGNVQTFAPVTAFAIRNGTVTGDSVVFKLSIDGSDYDFTGTVFFPESGKFINGHISSSGVLDGDGSWSAQAQSGPGEDKNKHPDKHAKQASR